MSVQTIPPKDAFRIDMLWNDSRYRSSFLQIVALFVTLIVLLYLINNVSENLAALGKELGFSFMSTPASYDINQRPLEYTSRDSHARASVIGMLNTLIVAVVGCFLATIIGVLAGVGRLSRNWIIRQLMAVYIEVVRNIPVLIQILLVAAVINETLPQPRDFRGEDPAASMLLWDSVAATNRGIYVPGPIWGDGSIWVIAALIIGIIAAVVFGRWAQRRQQLTGQIIPVLPVKAGFIVLTPLIVFFIAGMPIGLEYPELKGFNFRGGINMRDSYVALTLALAIYTGAFIAENVRAGIQAVSKGQTEAAYALGLQPGRTMSLVILPQALRIIIPPMISQYLNLTKNSSLALLVGYMDATGTLGGITLNQTGKEFETIFLLMAFYLSVSLSISAVMNLYNENSKLVERTSVTGGGFSFLNFFESMNGQWEMLKKGDAKMRPTYGIRGVLNLFVLFYAIVWVLLLNYVFIEKASDIRPSYFTWSYTVQIAALAMVMTSFGALITCIFKSPRFIDMAVLELIVFVLAVLFGFQFSQLTDSLSALIIIGGGLIIRIGIIGYTVFGAQPNLTFFNRERRA
ncbi:MAG: ABC transporter permease subunit [Pseudomonadota bacterium]